MKMVAETVAAAAEVLQETKSPTKAIKAANKEPPNSEPKKHRKRKRHVYNGIRAQMEFYFGDANLTKDRFLKKLIDKDPFVPLQVFLGFNKMKSLAKTVEEIAMSLSNSQLLELDETLQKVRRKTALPNERNVDEKTLYVEALPRNADHDWVRKIFERFGAVTYISLPKYAKTRKIKEFGFIEFEEEKSIEKAVRAFQEFNGVLNMETAEPGNLTSVKSFLKEQAEQKKATDNAESEADEKETEQQQALKVELQLDEEPLKKRAKIEDENVSTMKHEDESSASETGTQTSDSATEDAKLSAVEHADETGADQAAKKKRRKKKHKSAGKGKGSLDLDAAYYELRVLPKRDWKRLRNKYLNLQREKISELKRKERQQRQQSQQKQAKESAQDKAEAASPPPAKKSKPNERKLRKMNMNFYGAGGEEEAQQLTKPTTATVSAKETKQNAALERAPLFNFEPGLIVEVSFAEPCVTIKEFKADMRQYSEVKYIDIKEGALHAHLRLETASAAECFMSKLGCVDYKLHILAGEAETAYWKKIEKDRELKLNKQVKLPKKRGREKIQKLLAKHTHFDDDVDVVVQ